jgi:pyridoxal phosphate enzyme (YggS family)
MSPSSPKPELEQAYRGILARIAATERLPGATTLIAVSKKQPIERIEELYRLGHRDFGENYAQELLDKAAELETRGCREIRWHFIGHLQTNKVKPLLPQVHCVHSVDSEKLAAEIARRQEEQRPGQALPVFIEVNLGHEPNKSGITPELAPALAQFAAGRTALRVLGLMCVPEAGLPETALIARFAELLELERRCRPATQGLLSMGMSHDFELAIAHGATHVRVGTALFGTRPSHWQTPE